MTRTVEQAREPRVDPQPGDTVRGVWRNPKIHMGQAAALTVQARLGSLVATSSTGDREIRWQLLSTWCQEDGWLSGWDVLHVADATPGRVFEGEG